jgi:hypothetical protein
MGPRGAGQSGSHDFGKLLRLGSLPLVVLSRLLFGVSRNAPPKASASFAISM